MLYKQIVFKPSIENCKREELILRVGLIELQKISLKEDQHLDLSWLLEEDSKS